MKAIFVAYNQAYNQEVANMFEAKGQRGYTIWTEVGGRGSVDGEPHLGSHAWPTQNHALLSMVPDELAASLIQVLRELDQANPKLGLRAWVLPVEDAI